VLRQFLEASRSLTRRGEALRLGLILLVGLLNGLLFVFIVPPWQHYDEPGHFEYAWLIANRPGLPQAGDYDQGMRREMAASMIEHDFFAGLPFRPNLLSEQEPIWIGLAQTADRPLYYWLAALPLRLVRTSDITFQLYLARLVSLGLYLVSIAACYAIVCELTHPGSPLRWLAPLSMTLLPGFADLMTAVNNDVGAVAFFSVFLWASLRLVRGGFSWLGAIGSVGLAATCVFTKGTVLLAAPMALLALALALLPDQRRRWVWPGLAVVLVAGLAFSLVWNGAAAWYCQGARCQVVQPPEEASRKRAIELAFYPPGTEPAWAIQSIPPEVIQAIRGQVVTLGAWIWADQPAQANLPALSDGRPISPQVVAIGVEPAFYAVSLVVPEDADRLTLVLRAAPEPGAAGVMYDDGVVLAQGEASQAGSPQVDAPGAATLLWADQPVENLARNSSFERPWPQVRPEIESRFRFSFSPLQILTSLSDLPGSAWYYRAAAENLQHTFWARFGWGHVSLAWPASYTILMAITLIGLLGAGWLLWRKRQALAWHALAFLGLAALGVWGAALSRGVASLFGTLFIPGARYAYPAIAPTILLLCAGWRAALGWGGRWLRLAAWLQYLIYVTLFVLLDAAALFSILRYYSRIP
jgi:hypothetical protein